MRGVVLAAGQGQRLRPDTDNLPKTLLPVDGDTTILDIALRNLAAAGVTDASVVVGYAAEAIEARVDAMSKRYNLRFTLFTTTGSTGTTPTHCGMPATCTRRRPPGQR